VIAAVGECSIVFKDRLSMSAMNATTPRQREDQQAAALQRLGLAATALPRHIAIIMDGNGRWAQQQGLPRHAGHQKGAQIVRPIVTECAHLNLQMLTLYSFSLENWKRPQAEIDFLMALYVDYLKLERPTMLQNNVRFKQIGRREGLSCEVLDELDRTADLTASHDGLTLALAINYGSRAEITDAAKALARQASQGQLDPEKIDEAMFSNHLYTAGLPDPDLLIRTAGEMRLSNYLLWQISYAELYVTDLCWPEFDVTQLHRAIHAFARRQRKFGAVPEHD
jgi:undecaprenyl diphosphate synthase